MTVLQRLAADRFVESEDVSEWSEVLSTSFGGLSASAPGPRNRFAAHLTQRDLAGLTVANVCSSPARIVHAGVALPHSDRRFLVKTQIRGESEIRTGVNVVRMIAGDFVVCDLSQPFSLSFDCDTEIVSIPIPVRFLERFMPHPDAIAFRGSDRSKATHGVVSDFLESLLRVRTLSASSQQVARLRDTYFELLALAFEQPDTALQLSSARSFHLARIKEQIDRRLEDEMFCLDELAQSLGMSKRYLHSVFSASGASVSSYIMSARLARAARLLRFGLGRKLTVAEAAYQCGFKSVAHFTRSFKAHYGETPFAYRNGASR